MFVQVVFILSTFNSLSDRDPYVFTSGYCCYIEAPVTYNSVRAASNKIYVSGWATSVPILYYVQMKRDFRVRHGFSSDGFWSHRSRTKRLDKTIWKMIMSKIIWYRHSVYTVLFKKTHTFLMSEKSMLKYDLKDDHIRRFEFLTYEYIEYFKWTYIILTRIIRDFTFFCVIYLQNFTKHIIVITIFLFKKHFYILLNNSL